jgi:hypothetical protein
MMIICGSSGVTAALQPLVHVAVYLSPVEEVGGSATGTLQVTGTVWDAPFQAHGSAFAVNCTV